MVFTTQNRKSNTNYKPEKLQQKSKEVEGMKKKN